MVFTWPYEKIFRNFAKYMYELMYLDQCMLDSRTRLKHTHDFQELEKPEILMMPCIRVLWNIRLRRLNCLNLKRILSTYGKDESGEQWLEGCGIPFKKILIDRETTSLLEGCPRPLLVRHLDFLPCTISEILN